MGWSNQKLGDYCEVIAGQSPEGKYYNNIGEGLPFYQGKKEFGERYIGEPQKWTTKITKEAKAGDILMSVRAPVGPINFSTQDICIGRGLAAIRPSDKLDKDFLFYYLLSKQDEIQGSEGAVFASINKSQIEALSFSYVELEEQKRIVTILDQAFTDIEQARAKTEQNLKNARELFESYLQQVFSQRGEGWGEYKLSNLCELISGQHIDAKNYNTEEKGIGYLTGPSDFGVLNPTVTKWTEHPKRTCINGDILITVKGSGVGKVNIMSADELAISRQLMAVRPTGVVGDLLYWFLSMQFEYFQSLANGAAIPGISRNDVLDLKLSIPQSADQQELIGRISQFNLKTAELERIYTDKLKSLDELKNSILQRAFSGELSKIPENDTSKGVRG